MITLSSIVRMKRAVNAVLRHVSVSLDHVNAIKKVKATRAITRNILLFESLISSFLSTQHCLVLK